MNLLRRLFRPSAEAPTTFRTPEGQRIYAIGDIHGRSDLLTQVTDLIAADIQRNPAHQAVTVFIGDYIDRGSDSPGVLERLVRYAFPTEIVALRGNHEIMLLDFLADPERGSSWVENGGLETLHSYGLDVRALRARKGFEEAAHSFREAFPDSHLRFIRDTKLWHAAGDFYFCHAGVRPGIPLASQRGEDLLWIRDPFLSSEANFGKLIVHGHTPVMEPEVRPNRINIDTGAYISGRLTCLVLEADRVRFLSTGQPR